TFISSHQDSASLTKRLQLLESILKLSISSRFHWLTMVGWISKRAAISDVVCPSFFLGGGEGYLGFEPSVVLSTFPAHDQALLVGLVRA
ncbi:hypothetical protein, partial [Pseudoalteromonas piscicida]|uniref:hypothetical protein n=1 Tax=Pseudoalteromonas piscicida TaxID=43662 RepID=UPI001BB1C53B